MPPSGVKESCIEFTAPQEASVVIVAKSAESPGPKRTSFPSMFPGAAETPRAWWIGLPRTSDHPASSAAPIKSIAMAAKTAQPWRVFPVIEPSV